MQYRDEILATINIAHHFESAFSREQIYSFLRVKLDYHTFKLHLDELINENILIEKNGMIFQKNLTDSHWNRKQWSKNIFRNHRKSLSILCMLPWIKFAGLTGANAFESCEKNDDIDLFFITSKDRLWICYLLLVIFSKLIRKREVFCINYLVDEKNIEIKEKNYFTAVQLVQMIPLFATKIQKEIIKNNNWIFNFLPNANGQININKFYLLKSHESSSNGKLYSSKFLSMINSKIYYKYSQRLAKKFPEAFGTGILLTEGAAKLNRLDHQNIYNKLFDQISPEKIAV